jgi:hypothetical protein
VNSFIVDAGSNKLPAFVEYSVSPRVSETIIAPQDPLRVRAFRNVPISDASASADSGEVKRSAGGGVRRAVGRRVVFGFELFAAAGRVVAFLAPLLALVVDDAPPSCAVELAIGSASARVVAKAMASRGACRGELRREKITMFDLATGVPGTAETAGLALTCPTGISSRDVRHQKPLGEPYSFKKIFRRWSTDRIANHTRTKVMANSNDASLGGSHEA